MQITIDLTQEQLWGVQFVVQTINAGIQSQNDNLPEGQEPTPLYTPESYMQYVMATATDSYYQQLIEHKKRTALQMFDGLTQEQQAELVAQLGIPDVIQGQ